MENAKNNGGLQIILRVLNILHIEEELAKITDQLSIVERKGKLLSKGDQLIYATKLLRLIDEDGYGF